MSRLQTAALCLAIWATLGVPRQEMQFADTDPPPPAEHPVAGDRFVDLDAFGDNPIGNPSAFINEDGYLVVDCDSAVIICDDEGA